MSVIYFDNSATTKMSKGALDALNEMAGNYFGNPSSLHALGLDAEKKLSLARDTLAKSVGLLRYTRAEVIFTSGGTESNNIAILGSVFAKKRQGNEKILTTVGEHSSVEEPLAFLERMGYNIVRVPTTGGELDLEFIKKNARGCILATFMHVNNETGALYDLPRAFEIVREQSPDAVLHADCVQSYQKVKFTKKSLGADLISVSGHKVNGPKGVGALFVGADIIKAKKLSPLFLGGGQESGLRSGTENLYSVCAFAKAVSEHMENKCEAEKIDALRDYIVEGATKIDGVRANLPKNRAPHIVNLTVFGIRSETLLHYLSREGIYVSSGSACASNAPKKASAALLGFGLSEDEADSSVRISLSAENTKEEADKLFCALENATKALVKR